MRRGFEGPDNIWHAPAAAATSAWREDRTLAISSVERCVRGVSLWRPRRFVALARVEPSETRPEDAFLARDDAVLRRRRKPLSLASSTATSRPSPKPAASFSSSDSSPRVAALATRGFLRSAGRTMSDADASLPESRDLSLSSTAVESESEESSCSESTIFGRSLALRENDGREGMVAALMGLVGVSILPGEFGDPLQRYCKGTSTHGPKNWPSRTTQRTRAQ